MAKPTHEDAELMIQIAQWSSLHGLSEAQNWVWSDDASLEDYAQFNAKHPRGSEGRLKANKVCQFYETLGTLYKQGLFSGDLLFDWLAVDSTWDRVKAFALGVRAEAADPRLYENFEAAAKSQKEWEAQRG
jgi:hypothetical protein